MGQQYNKVEKKARRTNYKRRLKQRIKIAKRKQR